LQRYLTGRGGIERPGIGGSDAPEEKCRRKEHLPRSQPVGRKSQGSGWGHALAAHRTLDPLARALQGRHAALESIEAGIVTHRGGNNRPATARTLPIGKVHRLGGDAGGMTFSTGALQLRIGIHAGVPRAPMMRRCLIIEDDAENAQYVATGLRELGWLVTVCRDGVDAVDRAIEEAWDVIILDRMLPNDVDGLSILTTLRSLGRKTPVLVLSALAATDERVRGFKAGGDDYLTKPFAFSELTARIEAILRRAQPDRPREMRVADMKVDLISRSVERAGRTIPLQPREFRLLAFLLLHQGRVVTRTMLLEAVWDYRFDPQTNVIDVHISRLRGKIDKDASIPLIHTVRGVGYTLSPDGAKREMAG
jgi:two-component system, OmpR family, response regulator